MIGPFKYEHYAIVPSPRKNICSRGTILMAASPSPQGISTRFGQTTLQPMKNLQNHTTTLLDPNVQSQNELYGLCERLSNGLPGLTGNTLLLLRLGVPTPSAGLAFPQALREQMTVQFYLDAQPGKHFIRHKRPASGAESSEGGPVHRFWLSRLPIPQKHQAIDRLGF